jgi:Tat protein translocase TatB subunit
LPTSLGPAEILVILVVALIVLGPKRLPEAGRQVGKAIAEVRKWSQGFQDEIRSTIDPDASRPSYSQPQPGYTPPIPVVPAETAPPSEPEATAPPAGTNGAGATTGSHGLVPESTPTDWVPSDSAPTDWVPTDTAPPDWVPTDTAPTDPSGPPADDPPRT